MGQQLLGQKYSFHFGGANIKAVTDAFTDKEDITIINYLFHLMYCWWRKAGALGLRKRKYINDTKLILFNMELLCFMKLEDARNYYKLILDKIPKNNKFDEFIDYFEKSWFPKSESDTTKYDFVYGAIMINLISEKQKNQLIDSGLLEKYILFSNNAVELFNHLMNKYLDQNTRASISKFEEILKYILILMNSLTNKNDNNVERYAEKTLISDLLREIISLGYGKNGILLILKI